MKVEIKVPLVNGDIDYADDGVKLLLPFTENELKEILNGHPITREYAWGGGSKGYFGSSA